MKEETQTDIETETGLLISTGIVTGTKTEMVTETELSTGIMIWTKAARTAPAGMDQLTELQVTWVETAPIQPDLQVRELKIRVIRLPILHIFIGTGQPAPLPLQNNIN